MPSSSNMAGHRSEYFAVPAEPAGRDRRDRAWLAGGAPSSVVAGDARDGAAGWTHGTPTHGTPADDLMPVMTHFAHALGADGWVLTLVTEGGAEGAAPMCLARGEPDGAGGIDAIVRLASEMGHVPAVPMWLEDGPASIFVIPVPRGPGGDHLIVTLIFTEVDREERAQIERVALHHWLPVAACLRLWQAAGAERHRASGIEAGLNFVAIGVVLLADDGHIVFANDAARALLDRQDGIREHRGQLQATNRSDVAPLSNAIGYALAGPDVADSVGHAPLLALSRRQGGPLVASFGAMPMERGAAGYGGAGQGALVCFVDPGLDIHQLAQPVCRLFQLSRVETELACLLVSGRTLAEAAQSLHVKVDTARGYLKHIFLKTGSNRQVDLVRLIFSNLVRTRGG